MSRAILILKSCLGLLAAGTSALGSEAGGTVVRRSSTPWNDSSFQECGQSCLYQKANENIALQAVYLINKISFLSSAEDDQIRSNLSNFCLRDEEAQACFQRYKKLQLFGLQKMRSALIQNNDSAALLKSRVVDVGKGAGEPERPYFQLGSDGKARKPQVPYVVTFEDLQREYSQLERLTGHDYDRWARSLPARPSREDFVRMKEIYRNPDNPKDGVMHVIARDKSGNIQYDDAAYQAALKQYEDRMGSELARMKDSRPSLDRPARLKDAVADDSRRVFNESRMPLIEAGNRGNRKATIPSRQEIAFAGPKKGDSRVPAASTASAATAAGITGREQIEALPASSDRHFSTFTLTPDQILKAIQEIEKM